MATFTPARPRGAGPAAKLTGYSWRLWFIPVGESERETLFERVAVEAHRVARTRKLREFTIERDVVDGETVLVIGSEGADTPFRIEVSRERIAYRCECRDLALLGLQLETTAFPLLRATMVPFIARRLLRCNHSYHFSVTYPPAAGRRPNIEALTSRLAPGLASPIGRLAAARLGRVDLKWGIEAELGGGATTLWFDLTGAGNDGHTTIDAQVTIQSSASELPGPAWSINLHRVHRDAVPAIMDVLGALTAREATHGVKKQQRSAKPARARASGKRR